MLGNGASGKAASELLRAEGWHVEVAEDFDMVVNSPGIKVRSELQLGIERLKKCGTRLLAVTGSKGKSSVVKIVTEAINLSGQKAVACGNYGLPVSAVEGVVDWAVVEVSSFQLETTYLPPDTFEGAAILNLQEDHLERHGSLAVYHAVKKRLFEMSKCGIMGEAAPKSTLFAGSYFDNEVLAPNGNAAVMLMKIAGVDDAIIEKAFKAFQPLPHRMSLVAVENGVEYVDDSKATSLAALAAGVKMAGKKAIRLIAGGKSKGDDPKNVKDLLTKRVKKVYLIGSCAGEFFSSWSDEVECELCFDMATAVAKAKQESKAGEIVLLSPGTASYDQYKNFGERGMDFANRVKKEG